MRQVGACVNCGKMMIIERDETGKALSYHHEFPICAKYAAHIAEARKAGGREGRSVYNERTGDLTVKVPSLTVHNGGKCEEPS